MIKISMYKVFVAATTFCLLLLLSYFVRFHIQSTDAATATSNCIITNIGTPNGQPTLPPGCQSGKWPFAKKDPSQFRRTDAGWDLQENHIEDTATGKTWIYAVADGTVHKQCCTGGGYGPHYPYQNLQSSDKKPQPINYRGKHTSIFYGHVIMIPELEGVWVKAGTKIAWTGPRGCTLPGESWCGNGGSYWLEIGWGNSQPEGISSKCIDKSIDPYLNTGDPCAWTPAGQSMKDWLSGKPE